MVRRIRKQNKKGLAVSLGRLTEGLAKGIGGLLGFTAEMERRGKSDYIEHGEIEGKTKSGKEYRGAYGLRIKVGLDPKDFSAKGGSPLGWKGCKKLSNRVDK